MGVATRTRTTFGMTTTKTVRSVFSWRASFYIASLLSVRAYIRYQGKVYDIDVWETKGESHTADIIITLPLSCLSISSYTLINSRIASNNSDRIVIKISKNSHNFTDQRIMTIPLRGRPLTACVDYSYTLMFTDISQIWIKRCAWQTPFSRFVTVWWTATCKFI